MPREKFECKVCGYKGGTKVEMRDHITRLHQIALEKKIEEKTLATSSTLNYARSSTNLEGLADMLTKADPTNPISVRGGELINSEGQSLGIRAKAAENPEDEFERIMALQKAREKVKKNKTTRGSTKSEKRGGLLGAI